MNIYVGTYHKYNSGSLFGEWIDVTDFDSKEEFYNHIAELHNDEPDPEFMFQDWEYIPDNLIGESWVHEAVWNPKIQEVIMADEEDLIGEWNEYQYEACSGDDAIYENDEYFFETHFTDMMTAIKAVYFGKYNFGHDYVKFNGYGNLDTTDFVKNWIDKEDLIEYLLLNL